MTSFKRVPYRGATLLLMRGEPNLLATIDGGAVALYDDQGKGWTLQASILTTPEQALGLARMHLRGRALGTWGGTRRPLEQPWNW